MNVKELLKIEDVLQYYWIRLGRDKKTSCPFHTEKDASFSVNTSKQYFKCFGCGVGGDVIDFTKKYFGINYLQALTKLSHDFNLGLSNNKPDYRNTIRIKNQREIKEKIKNSEKLLLEFAVLEFKRLERLFEKLKPIELGGDLRDDFISVMTQKNYIEDWLLTRRNNNGT